MLLGFILGLQVHSALFGMDLFNEKNINTLLGVIDNHFDEENAKEQQDNNVSNTSIKSPQFIPSTEDFLSTFDDESCFLQQTTPSNSNKQQKSVPIIQPPPHLKPILGTIGKPLNKDQSFLSQQKQQTTQKNKTAFDIIREKLITLKYEEWFTDFQNALRLYFYYHSLYPTPTFP